MSTLKLSTLLLVTVGAAIGFSIPASAAPKGSKVYGANGRRIAVIKETAFGRKVYGPNGRRVATIKGR